MTQPAPTTERRLIPQHSSKSNEHYTPAHVVELARTVLGGFDLDPASCAQANQTVQAARYIALPDDGLAVPWNGSVFLNPPGGRTPDHWRKEFETPSNATAWWRKLIRERTFGNVTSAIFIGFTLEILRSTQGRGWTSALGFPFCVPAKRLHFVGDQPTHGNAIIYVGPHKGRFAEVFEKLGAVRL